MARLANVILTGFCFALGIVVLLELADRFTFDFDANKQLRNYADTALQLLHVKSFQIRLAFTIQFEGCLYANVPTLCAVEVERKGTSSEQHQCTGSWHLAFHLIHHQTQRNCAGESFRSNSIEIAGLYSDFNCPHMFFVNPLFNSRRIFTLEWINV